MTSNWMRTVRGWTILHSDSLQSVPFGDQTQGQRHWQEMKHGRGHIWSSHEVVVGQ